MNPLLYLANYGAKMTAQAKRAAFRRSLLRCLVELVSLGHENGNVQRHLDEAKVSIQRALDLHAQ